jgi:modulator of FtsH protease HflK
MPRSNQGRGPWGSGGKGPLGNGAAIVRPLAARLRRVASPQPGQAANRAGGRGPWARSGADRASARGALGTFRILPGRARRARRGTAFRQIRCDVQLPGLCYHLPYPIETAQTPKALHLNKIDIGMHTDDYLRRGTRSRDMPKA